MNPSVTVRGLTKRYGRTVVLDGLDLDFGRGVTGLLGPNGAGKTTLLRGLATTLAFDRGRVRALGLDPADREQRTRLRRRLGYLPQDPGFYPHFTLVELVDYMAILKEMTDRRARHREVRRVLEEVGLSDRATTKVRKLSGGMKRRLALAQALIGEPDLLILDEPTAGLDPGQRLRFRALISRLGESRTVLLSTHQTEDVAALCERVIVLSQGRAVFQGSPGQLAGAAAGQVWICQDPPEGSALFWRAADGRYRTVGPRPRGGTPADPTIEDGYLLLLGEPARAAA
ncbi:ABC transporter ATP-binding protein [Sphaerisporangium siamense]|uniref:ABC-2 type transport system ATP-binding protein n=1 Tax=Sphaerisporangium siamense TaxID=795645 RepID=A0A7W7DDC6_9ACTN|nr:ATP-binding cassette domain-containing protein [Sphaerisporangium siamense]MBB4703925.1 ABC-2 type transport system ATP-binding protein [Sphaerisporangium siamense]GII82396.1 ABC transporter ATP-binding protein [Sphaerisporangium siamense]